MFEKGQVCRKMCGPRKQVLIRSSPAPASPPSSELCSLGQVPQPLWQACSSQRGINSISSNRLFRGLNDIIKSFYKLLSKYCYTLGH
jgi:hypothetical protein